jgi:hypothetical protein
MEMVTLLEYHLPRQPSIVASCSSNAFVTGLAVTVHGSWHIKTEMVYCGYGPFLFDENNVEDESL